jgi:hypothetical protein
VLYRIVQASFLCHSTPFFQNILLSFHLGCGQIGAWYVWWLFCNWFESCRYAFVGNCVFQGRLHTMVTKFTSKQHENYIPNRNMCSWIYLFTTFQSYICCVIMSDIFLVIGHRS